MGLRQRINQFHVPDDLKNSEKIRKTMFRSLVPDNDHQQDMNYLILGKKLLQADPQVVPEQDDYNIPFIDVPPPPFSSQFFKFKAQSLTNLPAIERAKANCHPCSKIGKELQEEHRDQENNTTDLIVPDQQSAAGSGDNNNSNSSSDSFCSLRSRRYESYSSGSHDSSSSYDHEFDDEESEGFEQEVPSKISKGLKRKQIAETSHHNSSDKRRRVKINKKMVMLQELVPNCDKMDKVLVLDKAIEYLKSLQFQLQMMLMGMNLHMSPVISPMGMHQMTPYLNFPCFSPVAMPIINIGQGNNPANFGAVPMVPMSNSPFFPLLQQHSHQWPPFSFSCLSSFQNFSPQSM